MKQNTQNRPLNRTDGQFTILRPYSGVYESMYEYISDCLAISLNIDLEWGAGYMLFAPFN